MTDPTASAPAEEENFASMLENFCPSDRREVRPGERVRGRVLAVGKDLVYIDAGMKIDAVVERAELTDAEGNLLCAEGDELELFVTRVAEQEIRLSRAIAGTGGMQLLREAFRQGAPVEGRVREVCKGGYQVELLQRRAFCPLSQIDLAPVADPAVHVGATYPFLITRIEDRGRNIVVSRRALLAREREALQRQFLEGVTPGDVLEGTVTRLAPFGAFVEIAPGLEGMVHVSEMSYTRRVVNSTDVVRPGDEVAVVVKSVDAAKKRIALSLREAEGDPWAEVPARFPAGRRVEGVLEKKESFGWFVRLAPGITGLLPIGTLRRHPRAAELEPLREGAPLRVEIAEVQTDRRRISLAPAFEDEEGDWRAFGEAPAEERLGALGEKLRKALAGKERPSP